MAVGRVNSVQIIPSRITAGGFHVTCHAAPGLNPTSNEFADEDALVVFLQGEFGISEGAARRHARQANETRGIVAGMNTATVEDTPVGFGTLQP